VHTNSTVLHCESRTEFHFKQAVAERPTAQDAVPEQGLYLLGSLQYLVEERAMVHGTKTSHSGRQTKLESKRRQDVPELVLFGTRLKCAPHVQGGSDHANRVPYQTQESEHSVGLPTFCRTVGLAMVLCSADQISSPQNTWAESGKLRSHPSLTCGKHGHRRGGAASWPPRSTSGQEPYRKTSELHCLSGGQARPKPLRGFYHSAEILSRTTRSMDASCDHSARRCALARLQVHARRRIQRTDSIDLALTFSRRES